MEPKYKAYSVLVINGRKEEADSLVGKLESIGHPAKAAYGSDDGMSSFLVCKHPLVIMNWELEGASGSSFLQKIKSINNCSQVIVMTRYSTIDSAAAAIRAGAYDFLPEPLSTPELDLIISRALEQYHLEVESTMLKNRLVMLALAIPVTFLLGYFLYQVLR